MGSGGRGGGVSIGTLKVVSIFSILVMERCVSGYEGLLRVHGRRFDGGDG